MTRRVIIGSRGSDLALAQARHIAGALNGMGVDTHIEVIQSKGDAITDLPLAKIGGKGLFTKELEVALLDGRIDLAVHSLKDLPTELPSGLRLAAVPARENPMDVLVGADGGMEALPNGARVATGSPRRKAQLLAHRPDLRILGLRGNVPTRLRKLREEAHDAIVLAAAGLRRLRLEVAGWEIPPEIMLPAPGQGALGIEAREGDEELLAWLEQLEDPEARAAVAAERALLRALGGGCQTPLGALGRIENGSLVLMACVCGPEGTPVIRAQAHGPRGEAEALGAHVAELLQAQGAHRVVHPGGTDPGPLCGRRIVVTRSTAQAGALSAELLALGAEVIDCAAISIHPVQPEALDAADAFDWLVFTSANGVREFARALTDLGRDIAEYRSCSICAIGPATASALRAAGLSPALVPEAFIADAILDALIAVESSLAGKRFLLPRGSLARPALPEGLRMHGAFVTEVVVYETRPAPIAREQVEAMLAARPDVVTFTSSSTVHGLWGSLSGEQRGTLASCAAFISIGPVTSSTARDLGVPIAREAARHDVPGLVEAVTQYFLETGSGTEGAK